MKRKRDIMVIALMLVAALGFAEGSREAAQKKATADYPTKPIKLIVPYAAGGGSDTTARMIVQKLEQVVGQPIPIVNIGGAGGGLGMQELLEAEPDGYTMGMDIINMWTRKALETVDFGPEAFEPIAQCGTYYLVEAARAASPYANLAELFEAAKKAPDTIQEATNIGAITHFTSLALMDATDAKVRLVHIGDGSQRISGVLGGHVEMTIMGTHEVHPYYKSGDMKVLAVAAPQRIKGLEEAPTARELGIDVVQSVDYWYFMPKGTPQDRVQFMADALEQVMNDPEIVNRMESIAMEPSFLRGPEFEKHIEAQGKNILSIAERHNLAQQK